MRGKTEEKFLLLDEATSIKNGDKVYKEICEEEFFRIIAASSRPKEFNFYSLSFREFIESFLDSYLSDGNFRNFKSVS